MLWADSVVLVAGARAESIDVLETLTVEVSKRGFHWQPSSMEYLACRERERGDTMKPLEMPSLTFEVP
eukprot:4285586-Pyramimonas_sp.AAC.1